MNLGRSISSIITVVTSFALVSGITANSQEARTRRGRAIEFSKPRNDVISSNVNLVGAKKAALKDLERELKKPFELMSPGEEYVDLLKPSPSPRPVLSNTRERKMKEFLERRNEWIFLAPEEILGTGMSAEDLLEIAEIGLGGEPRIRKKAIERYYERMDKARADSGTETNENMWSDQLTQPKLGGTEGGLSELAFGEQANPLFAAGRGRVGGVNSPAAGGGASLEVRNAARGGGGTFAEVFGFGRGEPARWEKGEMPGQEERMQEFIQLLEKRSLAMSNMGLGALNVSPSPPTVPPMIVAPAGGSGISGRGYQVRGQPAAINPGRQATLQVKTPLPFEEVAPSWQTTPPVREEPRASVPQSRVKMPKRKF